MPSYADELRMLADASEPDAARILRGAADALILLADAARDGIEQLGFIIDDVAPSTGCPADAYTTLIEAIAACSLPEPQTVLQSFNLKE